MKIPKYKSKSISIKSKSISIKNKSISIKNESISTKANKNQSNPNPITPDENSCQQEKGGGIGGDQHIENRVPVA